MNESIYETPEFEEAVLKIVQKYVEEYSAEHDKHLLNIWKKETEIDADKIVQIINSDLEKLIDSL